MRYVIFLSSFSLFLSACSQNLPHKDSVGVHPLVGCWENETGLEREVWRMDPSGWLVGYAASQDIKGSVMFFEHMRIEGKDDARVLVVTGQDSSATRFIRRLTDDPVEYHFENPAHDYPQLIVYKRNGDELNAYIALMDGTKKVTFDKSTCQEGEDGD